MRISQLTSTLGFALAAAAIGGVVYVKTLPIPTDTSYVGSARCAPCHLSTYSAWNGSQHTKMMRPVDDPGVLVARFEEGDERRRFEQDEAVWAIGGKWEQQFMGHDGEGETLLPGSWLGLAEDWDFKGWDGWELPIPRKRCHGCHTVGLDTETGTFVEPNIGCESCHGPGEWHARTFGFGRIHSTADAQVCGQCHSRGSTPSGEFFFPVGYRPGLDLDALFEHAGPTAGQNSSYWWGNGRPRKRHQEYTAWRTGGHANSLRSLGEGYDGRYGVATDDCLACHAGDAVLASPGEPGLEDARHGITCSVCHNVHGDLTAPRLGCETCHTEGALYHRPERNAAHVPCPDEAGVTCVDCHMPLSVRTGGGYALHDHSPGIIPPLDTERWGTPSSCANGGCHATASAGTLQTLYFRHYGAPSAEPIAGIRAASRF